MEQYLTVTALTKYIKAKLEGDRHLFSILLKGEISNFKRHSRGHLYFTLKDENAQISAIMFSRDAERIEFLPKEGDHVLVQGRISVYEPSGTYSIQVTSIKPDGIGELYLKYEALKKELEEKGYFDPSHKRPIPKFPKKIGVVTSPTGAVIQDIINTVTRRYLLTEIHLYPALVQGPDSAQSIRNQILLANQIGDVDVLIVGRGGGSIEDLWGFNEMPVIDAIYHSKIPVITAIGHETDFTLSDFVSDLRAPTPTAAAELATPNKDDLIQKLNESEDQLRYRLAQLFESKKTTLLYLDQRLERISPQMRFDQLKLDLNRLDKELEKTYRYLIETKRYQVDTSIHKLRSPEEKIELYYKQKEELDRLLKRNYDLIFTQKSLSFESLRKMLVAINPLAVMDKGFALITKDETIITSIDDIAVDDRLDIRLKDGRIQTKVIEKKGEA